MSIDSNILGELLDKGTLKRISGVNMEEVLLKPDPIVDLTKGKFSEVSLIPYLHTRSRLVPRCSSGEERVLGYCSESPKEVLERVFENYDVTRYNGYELFGSSDFDSTTPMLGLGISPFEPPKVYGVRYYGKLKGILNLKELSKAKRSGPISNRDIERILKNLSDNRGCDILNSEREQDMYDIKEIMDIVEKFKR